jgi:hypothetical protein
VGSEIIELIQPQNSSRPGYMKGKRIETLTEFVERLEERRPFYWRHKFMAAGFIEHWSFVQVANSIKHGVLRTADERRKSCKQQ